jgi:aspartate/methionine/tyrosine aminotransferase
MRTDLVSPGVGEMTYEIRNIVNVAEKLQKCGVKINWENIGDPIVKGEQIPQWMKEIVASEAMHNDTWGYCHTRGLLETREFICELTNSRNGAKITPDDIIFFNGLGDAIAKIYGCLDATTRVLVPSPTYTTHTLAEAANSGEKPLCYRLKAEDNWHPDMAEMRRQVEQNPAVAAIMLINPDNPTGMVYPKETLQQIVAIAKEFDLFIIADEVYNNIVYNGQSTVPISDVIGDVPAIALKGISKEFPWPGSRCGWIEVYNFGRDAAFQKYINAILTLKMNEVCSTTLPQKCMPIIMKHPQYAVYLEERTRRYEKMSNITWNFLKDVPGLVVNRTNGAFYMSVAFRDGLLTNRQSLPIDKPEVKELVEKLVNGENVSPDKRFVYYTLAATGICVVPLSSFNTPLQGFRVTLLERDEKECSRIYGVLAEKIREYLAS